MNLAVILSLANLPRTELKRRWNYVKITKIKLLRVNPTERGWGPLLCRVYTDAGIYGDGEVALNFGRATEAAFGMMRDMAGLLIGEDPLAHEVVWNKLYTECYWGKNGGPIVFGGISAFDIALWDIKGKAYQAPLYQLLGGRQRTSLRAYASQLQFGWGENTKIPARSVEDYAKYAHRAVEQGYDCVKVNVFSYREDQETFPADAYHGLITSQYLELIEARVAAIREAIGSDVDLILENHGNTDALSAVQMIECVKKYGIYYVEEPCLSHPDLLAKVHQETKVPIAGGERIYSRWQYHSCLKAGALQVIQPDIGTAGGISEVKKICDMATLYDAAVQLHVSGSPIVISASLQMEAALPNFIIHEHNAGAVAPSVQAIGTEPCVPQNGRFTVSDRPGIGNEISKYAFNNSTIVTVE